MSDNVKCPISGLPVVSLPGFTEINMAFDNYITLIKIGESIVLISCKGNQSNYDISAIDKLNDTIESFCTITSVKKPYIRIYDKTVETGKLSNNVMRKQSKFFNDNQDSILGLIIIQGKTWLTSFIKLAMLFYTHSLQFKTSDTYTEAINIALKILDTKLKSDNDKKKVKPDALLINGDINVKPEFESKNNEKVFSNKTGITVSEKDISELNTVFSRLLMTENSDNLIISESNPLSQLTETLQFLKQDLAELRKKDRENTEMRLKESEKTRNQLLSIMEDLEESNNALKKSEAFQRIVAEVSSNFVNATSLSLDAKIHEMLRKTGEFFEVDRVSLFGFSPDKQKMINTHEWVNKGITPQKNIPGDIFEKDMPWWNEEMKSKGFVYIRDVEKLQLIASGEKKILEIQGVKTLLSIEIMYNKIVTGVLCFYSVTKKKYWENNHISQLKILLNTLSDAQIKIKTEKDLISARIDAESANIAKSQFLANMSHEIRTPLNGVIGFAEVLKTTDLTDDQQEYADTIISSGQALLAIINDILDFSKIEAGMLHLELIYTDLYELINISINMMKISADKKGLKLFFHIDPSAPRFILTDPVRLKQILINLLSNGVKFTNNGEVELRVLYESHGECKGKFSFSIRDTGIGITDEQMNKLFKAFSQADSSTTRRFGGTGLGLIISDKIAHEMGSKIHIDSKPGEGSIFSFDIITEIRNKESTVNECVIKTKFPVISDKRLKILITDDYEVNIRVIKTFIVLKFPYSEIIDASDGHQAIEQYAKNSPSIILMDVQMPGMNGLDATKTIRELEKKSGRHVPIIALTAGAFTEDKEKCIASGMDDFITKPFEMNKIWAVLEKYS